MEDKKRIRKILKIILKEFQNGEGYFLCPISQRFNTYDNHFIFKEYLFNNLPKKQFQSILNPETNIELTGVIFVNNLARLDWLILHIKKNK